MATKYIIGVFASAFLGFWSAQTIIYFYGCQLEFEPNAGKRRRNFRSATKVSLCTAAVASIAWFLQKYIVS
jgi:hypothetical protein